MKLIKTLVAAAVVVYVVKRVYKATTEEVEATPEVEGIRRRACSFVMDDSYQDAGSHGNTIPSWSDHA
jgi:hypothetical protein